MSNALASREAATECSLGRKPKLFHTSFATTPASLPGTVKQFFRLATHARIQPFVRGRRIAAAVGGSGPATSRTVVGPALLARQTAAPAGQAGRGRLRLATYVAQPGRKPQGAGAPVGRKWDDYGKVVGTLRVPQPPTGRRRRAESYGKVVGTLRVPQPPVPQPPVPQPPADRRRQAESYDKVVGTLRVPQPPVPQPPTGRRRRAESYGTVVGTLRVPQPPADRRRQAESYDKVVGTLRVPQPPAPQPPAPQPPTGRRRRAESYGTVVGTLRCRNLRCRNLRCRNLRVPQPPAGRRRQAESYGTVVGTLRVPQPPVPQPPVPQPPADRRRRAESYGKVVGTLRVPQPPVPQPPVPQPPVPQPPTGRRRRAESYGTVVGTLRVPQPPVPQPPVPQPPAGRRRQAESYGTRSVPATLGYRTASREAATECSLRRKPQDAGAPVGRKPRGGDTGRGAVTSTEGAKLDSAGRGPRCSTQVTGCEPPPRRLVRQERQFGWLRGWPNNVHVVAGPLPPTAAAGRRPRKNGRIRGRVASPKNCFTVPGKLAGVEIKRCEEQPGRSRLSNDAPWVLHAPTQYPQTNDLKP